MVHLGRIFFIRYLLIFSCIFFTAKIYAQDVRNVQIKVFDANLNPVPNLELTIDDRVTVTTGSNGITFANIPVTSLPPRKVEPADRTLTAETANSTRSILEIIVRKKTFRRVTITFIDRTTSTPITNFTVNTQLEGFRTIQSDDNGQFILRVPIDMSIDGEGFFTVPDDYQIVDKNIDFENGTIGVEKIVEEEPDVVTENVTVQNQAQQQTQTTTEVQPPEVAEEPEIEITMDRLDSISSLTVLFSLVKDVEYSQLDSISKKRLDSKFHELSRLNTVASVLTVPMTDLITDSTIINDDMLTLIEKIKYEGEMLENFRSDFEVATNQIREKLVDGGENLTDDERSLLIQLIINLKDLLRKNEEQFYRNNTYYKQQIEDLQEQLVNILELEDKLLESEEARRKAREQILTVSLVAAALVALVILLTFLTRLFITQRNELARVNKELDSMNNNLEGLVAEKTESLAEINEELDTFLYRSSHNLRRPLTSIKGLASVAEMSLKDDLGLFDKVLQTSIEMEKMVDKLTMMNHINRPTDLQAIDIESVLASAEAKFAEQIQANKVTVTRNIETDITFNSYAIIFDLIVQNLFENAVFYSKLTKSGKPEIEINVQKGNENSLRFEIRDNGSGVDPNNIDKIWGMFYKGDPLSTGNGLGLYITKKAVEALEGKIKIETKHGEFCMFVIELPFVEIVTEVEEELVEEPA